MSDLDRLVDASWKQFAHEAVVLHVVDGLIHQGNDGRVHELEGKGAGA